VADEARLVSIEARLARLTFAEPDPAHRPFLTRQPDQLVAAVRRDLQSFGQIEHLIGEVGVAAPDATTHGVIWHDCGKLTGRIDCEGLLLLDDSLPVPRTRSRVVRVRRLPAATTVCIVHHGSEAGISGAYAAAGRWAAEQGYRPAGPIREWYLEGTADAPDAVTEIHLPIARGASA